MLVIIKVLLILLINNNSKSPINNTSINIKHDNYLYIEKINLKRKYYDINSEENTIEKNIQILKESIMPDQNNSIVFIAAHSGPGDIAYFNNLIDLEIDDKIILFYKNKKYTYYVKSIWEENKNGYINVNKDENKQLILTTCHPNKKNKQLVINATIKEP